MMTSLSGKKTKTVAYFIAAFKQWLKSSGKTQQQAALELETSQGAINNLLSGERSPSVGQMEKIATLLSWDLLDMLVHGRLLTEKVIPANYPHRIVQPSLHEKLNKLDGIALRTIEQVVDTALLAQMYRLNQTCPWQQSKNTASANSLHAESEQRFIYVQDIAEGSIVKPVEVAKVDELVVGSGKTIPVNGDDTA